MIKFLRLAAVVLGLTTLAPVARAQDMTTYSFGGTTIYIGGGFQYLSLPDIRFSGIGNIDDFRRQKNSDFSEYGGSAGAGIETALGFWGGWRVTGGVKGFWSSLENSDRTSCRSSACVLTDPNGTQVMSGPPVLINKTDRDVDYWGGSAELKFGAAEPVHTKPNLYRNDYFIVGADVRGIDQDNKLRGNWYGELIYTYNEAVDTTYYGGYVGLGGEYSFGFLGMGGLYDRLGLRTFINGRAGLYQAETDYDGRYFHPVLDSDQGILPTRNTRISKSSDDLAFIGSISLETRKQIGARTSLSLWTDYEYISSVPKLRYADYGGTTRIEEGDAFATRTMLRLNIGFGAQQLYEPPLK